jgi:hypothetical protein
MPACPHARLCVRPTPNSNFLSNLKETFVLFRLSEPRTLCISMRIIAVDLVCL